MDPKLTELEQRISILETDQETRLATMEGRLEAMAQVVQSVADDTLRVCSALQEMEESGKIPNIPWLLSSTLVDFHHAYLNHQRDPTSFAEEVVFLKEQIRLLREQYRSQ